MTTWWREASQAAELDRRLDWCGVGTTAFLRLDVAGSQYEAFVDRESADSCTVDIPQDMLRSR